MGSVDIQEVTDRTVWNPAALQSLASLRSALQHELAPDDEPASPEWALSFVHLGDHVVRRRPLVAIDRSGAIIGQTSITLELAGGNNHIAEVAGIEVHPDHRRRGVGRALLSRVVAIAEEEGRTSLVPWGIRSEASSALWGRFGIPEVSVDRMSRLRLGHVDRNLLQRWRTESTARAQGYSVRGWKGRCPDDQLAGFVAAQQGMNDAPTDGLDVAEDTFDEASVRARERSWAERGGEIWGLVATSSDGEPAGMTELIVMGHRPSYVMQQGTTTLAAHRNLGVGRWLKAEMLVQLLSERPAAEVVETGNAASNRAMLAINHELGFRPFVELTIRQISTAELRARLSQRRSRRPRQIARATHDRSTE